MKLSELELKKAIDGCIKGDNRSQEIVFKTYYGKMLSVAMRYTKEVNLAQDLIQESFIKVFDKIGVYDHKGSFEGWIRRIVVNTTIDYLRKKKHEYLVLDDDESYDGKYGLQTEEETDDSIFATLKPDVVLSAIEELSPAYKTVFNMYVVEGYPHQEIADMLNISVGTSKSNLAKAKMNLRKILLTELNNKNE